MSTTRAVIDFAKSNGGVFTMREASALGMSHDVLAQRLTHGIFVRIARGVYALPGASTRPDLLMRAACRSLGAVVSHESAAVLHEMRPVKAPQPSVTVPHRSTHRFPGITVHQSTDLLPAHTARISGLTVTKPERTIVDLAHVVSSRRLERIVDNGLASRAIDLSRLVDLHVALSRKGKPGVKKLRRILEDRTGGPLKAESELEAEFLRLIEKANMPRPTVQYRAPWLKPIDGRVDFAYETERIVIEVDGRRWHALNDAFESDRRRDNAAQLAGWLVLRFTWKMVVNEPVGVIATIRSALVRARMPTS